jgi:ATP-binding cassette subfamily C protein
VSAKPARASDLHLLGAFLRDFAGFVRGRIAAAVALVAAGTLLEGVGLLMLVPLLGIVLGSGSGSQRLDSWSARLLDLLPATSSAGRLAWLLAGFGLLMVLRGIVLLRRDVLLARIQTRFVESWRQRLVERLAASRWDVVARLRHGRVTHIIGTDVQSLRVAAQLVVQNGVALAMLAGQVLLAILISPLIALLLIPLLVAGSLWLRPVARRARALGSELSSAQLGLMNSTTQFLGGLKLALSQDLQRSYVEEYRSILAGASEREVAFARQRAKAQVILTGFAAAVAGLVLLFDLVFVGSAPAALIALLVILGRTSAPLTQLQQGAQQVFHSLPAFANIRALDAELGAATREEPAPAAFALASTEIAFRQVSFDHGAAGEGGICAVDVTIGEGELVGLAGSSGAGKTTFADLLVGLYPPASGTIEIGGAALAGPVLTAWRRSLAYVSQDPFLFHDSLRANLLWAAPGASEAEIRQALEMAGADRLVRRLPAGLDTLAGERGSLLSGGERQRIALARALLRKPRLLLLDEATNAIDVEGEQALLRRLAALPSRPTIIVIAHRETTLAEVDRVIAMESGRIVSDSGPRISAPRSR